MTEQSENFENITEYYAQLTNESKIYFTNTLFKLGLEKVSKVLFDSMFSDDMLELHWLKHGRYENRIYRKDIH
jgi:hypothetical protein